MNMNQFANKLTKEVIDNLNRCDIKDKIVAASYQYLKENKFLKKYQLMITKSYKKMG